MIVEEIRSFHVELRGASGAPGVRAEFQAGGRTVNRERVHG
ncbi:hypothetical protein [Streptomyces sp. NPDC051014]